MDKFQLIQQFVAVVDHGGFAPAARALHVSPPALTRAINELEQRLGLRLLTRTTRTVRVTEAGLHYAQDCRRILEDLAQADESARGFHGAPQGLLTVTAPGWFGAKFLAPIVADYLERHPGMRVNCAFTDRVVSLIEEGVDVALRFAALPDSSLQAIPIGKMEVVLCAAPRYLNQRGTPGHPSELVQHDCVASSVGPGGEWRFRQRGRPLAVRVDPRLQCATNETAVSAACAGFGFTQQMLYKVADPLHAGQLRRVLPEFDPAPLPVTLLHREGRYVTKKVRSFLDLATEHLRSLPVLRSGA